MLFSPGLRFILMCQLVLAGLQLLIVLWQLYSMARLHWKIDTIDRNLIDVVRSAMRDNSRVDPEPPATIPFRPRS